MGLSSIQLNNLERGFSFRSKKKLDMTMGLSDTTAFEVVNNLSEKELKLIIKIFGERGKPQKLQKILLLQEKKKKITTVDELVKIIEKSKKKIFQVK